MSALLGCKENEERNRNIIETYRRHLLSSIQVELFI